MIGFLIIGILVLIAVIAVQIGKVTDLAAKIRGEEEVQRRSNESSAVWMVIFMIVFLVACVASAWYYKDAMLGYGPHLSASAHGGTLDTLFNTTLIFTVPVFIITHILTFWYAYKYRDKPGRKATFFSHSNRLELIWTGVPAVVMAILVVQGLIAWNEIMFDVEAGDDYIEIEATGSQFLWEIRYPGADNKLGTRDYKMIKPANNPLGQDWKDEKNIDDIHVSGEFLLPVNKKVRVRIIAKDVLHNFYLPHFRVKMDAIPGLPTYFVFTPTLTTEEYRNNLKDTPEYQVPYDDEDPSGPQRWEMFNYELACAELCGKGHYSMRRVLRVVSEEEYEVWINEQSSYYMSTIRNTDDDPFKGMLLPIETKQRSKELGDEIQRAISNNDFESTIKLTNLFFETGSAFLKDNSKYELENIVNILSKNKGVTIEISGHTDSTGDVGSNMILSSERAKSVVKYLTDNGISPSRLSELGYGSKRPSDTNETTEGRQNYRRIEMRITSNNKI
ncbi:MAG: OmpA family protein [Saprospiraceae bacterium]